MLRSNRRLIYHPQYVRGFAVAMLRAARDLETLRQDLRFECDRLREEVREAKAELARLQAIEGARAAERDPNAKLN